jgi:uncharacterized protein YjbJ (UPF0337 family)
MDNNRAEGIVDKMKGSVKQTVGDVTGDRKMQAEGTIDKIKGEAKNIAGGVKDAMRDDDGCGCGHKH